MDATPIDDATVQFLANLPYFMGLAPSELTSIRERCHGRTLQAGEAILLEGDRADGLFLVQSGSVRVYKSSPEGREQVLIVVGPGETFNDVPVFDGGPNPASAQAAENGTTVCMVPTSQVSHLVATNPLVAANVTRVLASRLRHLTMLVEDLSLRQIVQRVAKLLLVESARGTGGIQLTQQEMATRVGTAREVVSRALRELERRGAISRRDSRSIGVDAPKLQAMLSQSDEPPEESTP